MGRSKGRVFLRGRIYWAAYFLNGEEFRESTDETDEKRARKFLDDKLDEVGAARRGSEQLVTPKMKRVKVRELCRSLREYYQLHGKGSPQNLCHLKLTETEFGDIPALATTLISERINAYVSTRRAEKDADATINRKLGMLLQCYKHGVRTKRINAISIPYIPHFSEKGNERQGFLEPAQFEKLLKHIPDDGLRDFVQWGYKTGQRKSETSLMTWSMLNGDVVRIPGSVCKNGKDRTLPLTTELRAIIERRKTARQVKENGGVRMVEFIFHRKGRRVGEFKKSWKKACELAGVIGKLYHDLRRSFVKNGTSAGIPAAVLMRAGGWSTQAMLERYSIKTDEEVRRAMELTDKYVADAAKAQEESNVVAMQR
jgi:integrase